MSAEVYRNAFRYIAKTYFTQPNYYKAPTRLPNGSTADCCFFSLYQVCSPISLASQPSLSKGEHLTRILLTSALAAGVRRQWRQAGGGGADGRVPPGSGICRTVPASVRHTTAAWGLGRVAPRSQDSVVSRRQESHDLHGRHAGAARSKQSRRLRLDEDIRAGEPGVCVRLRKVASRLNAKRWATGRLAVRSVRAGDGCMYPAAAPAHRFLP